MTTRIDRLWPRPAENLTDDDLVSDRGPGVRVNFVSSIDGAATHDGLSGGLSGAADKRHFELLRRVCDVVLVGAGTVRDEGYGPMRVSPASARWRVEHGMPEHPVFAIVSGHLDLDENSRIFTEAPVRPIIVTGSRASGADRFTPVADVIATGTDHVDLPPALEQLRKRGLSSVLCEGGPSLFGALLAADAVDELCLTVSPTLEAGDSGRIAHGDLAEARGMALAQVLRSADTLLLRYRR
jgi:riboflavin biosynthesis pyrimidine reductase